MRKIQTNDNSFLMSLQNDYAFRALLGEERNKPVLADLLRAIISDPVENITLMNTHMTRGFEPEKEPILDIRASIAPNVQVDIEMQGWPFHAMPRRSIYYWSRIFANLQVGKGYDTLNRVIAINILNYSIIPIQDIHFCFQIREKENGYKLSDVLEIHVIELPKIHVIKEQGNNSHLIQWIRFLRAETEKELIMAAEGNVALKKAYQELKNISKDEQARWEYEKREIFLMDQITLKNEGRREGLQEGIETTKFQTVKNMIEMGFDDTTIAKATELTPEEIKKIRES